MKTHVVACGGHFWCSGGHANGWAILLTLATFAGIVLVVLLFAVFAGKTGYQPKPAKASHPMWEAYTFPVQAMTPRGTMVRMSCCRRGHVTPDAARRHADAVAERIRRTGR